MKNDPNSKKIWSSSSFEDLPNCPKRAEERDRVVSCFFEEDSFCFARRKGRKEDKTRPCDGVLVSSREEGTFVGVRQYLTTEK